MDAAVVIELATQALWITVLVSAPLLVVALGVGLAIGIVQAATSINEATLSFIPKLLAIAVTLALVGGWQIATMVDYTRALFLRIPTLFTWKLFVISIAAIDLVEHFFALMWPMLRLSALMLAAPVFSLPAMTVRLRIMFALVLAVMVYPMHDWPRIDPISPEGMAEIFNQILIGLLMGLILQVVTAAVVVGGQAISNAMGLSMATLIDSSLGNVPTISQFFIVLSTLIFVGLGGHALLVALIVESFATLPVGKPLNFAQVWPTILTWSSMIFLGALLISLPVMVTLLFITIGLGVITRAAPSLNIFSVGLPATIVLGFGVLIMAMGSIGARIQGLWVQALGQVRIMVGLG